MLEESLVTQRGVKSKNVAELALVSSTTEVWLSQLETEMMVYDRIKSELK